MKPIHVWQLGFFALAWNTGGFFQAFGFFALLWILEAVIDCANT